MTTKPSSPTGGHGPWPQKGGASPSARNASKPIGIFDETPSERQGRPTPVTDDSLWATAMNQYWCHREAGMSRRAAASAFAPLQNHPTLGPSARIMLDVAHSDPPDQT